MSTPQIFRKLALLFPVFLALAASPALREQNSPPSCKQDPQKPESKKAEPSGDALEKVLRRMDETAATFRTACADFVWTTYNSVVGEKDTDKGKIYFRRSGNETQMAAYVEPPSARQIVFSGGKVQVYTPGTGEVNVYDAGKHREEFETFLVLGFGSSGTGMRNSFEIQYAGEEKIQGVETAKLELTPISESIRNRFPKIDLWIDTQRGVSLRQQFFQDNGDYRLADYSNIKLNAKLPNDVFKLKTSGNPKTVNH